MREPGRHTGMKSAHKPTGRRVGSVRRSVTIPEQLGLEVRCVADERQLTLSRALVALVERGVEAEAAARARVDSTYETFMSETDSAKRDEAEGERIRAIFGEDSVADDPLH